MTDPFSPEYQKALRKEWAEDMTIKRVKWSALNKCWLPLLQNFETWYGDLFYARPADVLGEGDE